MTLHTKILEKILEENYPHGKIISYSGEQVKEAALLAMEKQAAFYRHISRTGFWDKENEIWIKYEEFGDRVAYTELELYEIWEGQKK